VFAVKCLELLRDSLATAQGLRSPRPASAHVDARLTPSSRTASEEDRDDRDEYDQHRDDVGHRQRHTTRDQLVRIAKDHVFRMPAHGPGETHDHPEALFTQEGVAERGWRSAI
jgi:hypothetical protein